MENDSKALPMLPKTDTKLPTKKTAVAVKNLPILKQKPVAVARIVVEKRAGM